MKKNLLFSLVLLCGLTFSYGQRLVSSSKAENNTNFPSALLQTAKFSGGCDTVGNFDPLTMTPTLFTADLGGYVSGHNGYGDIGKAEYFMAPALPSTVDGTILSFGVVYAGSPSSTIDVKVWDGSTGSPGTELGSTTVMINTLSDSTPNLIMFSSPVVVTGDYFIGITFNYANGDTVAIITSDDGEGANTAWEQWDTGNWYAYDSSSSWQLSVSHAIWSVECVITGINEGISSSNISIYPNPVRDRLNVVLPVEFKDISAVEVIDITGKTVLTSEFKSNHSLDVSSLTKGIYTLKVTAGDSVVQQKFMKE